MKPKGPHVLILFVIITALVSLTFFTGCRMGIQSSEGDIEAASEASNAALTESAAVPEESGEPSLENDPNINTADNDLESENIAGFFDNEAGFIINYPSDNISFSNNYFVNTAGAGILLFVEVKKIDDLLPDETLGYDRETSIKDEAALKEGKYGEDIDFAYEPSKKVIKIKDIYAKEFMVFGRYEVCDTVFERKLIFYNKGFQVIITLAADKNEVIKSMPAYFTTDTENCGEALVWRSQDGNNLQDDFYNTLNTGPDSEIVKKWLDSYSYITKNIQVNQEPDPDGSEIIFSTAKDIQSDTILNYEILNLYPQFLKIDTVSPENLQNLNFLIKNITENEKGKFKKYIEEMGEPDSSDDRVFTNYYQGDYSLSFPGSGLISLIYAVYAYTGGAHGSFTEFSFNYDTATSKEIMLGDLFRPDFDYLKFISDFSIDDLKKQMLEMGGSYDEKWLNEGAGPYEGNFRTFAISKDFLVIKFAQYQVAPYVFGTFNVIIPYRDFMEEINPDSALSDFLFLSTG